MNGKDNMQNEWNEQTQHPDYKREIVEVFRSNLTPRIKEERILDYHERDIAAALEMLSPEERGRLYHVLNAETLADILEYSENKIKVLIQIIAL